MDANDFRYRSDDYCQDVILIIHLRSGGRHYCRAIGLSTCLLRLTSIDIDAHRTGTALVTLYAPLAQTLVARLF